MAELRISELARRSGVSPSALRYYEDIGLLPAARTPAGYRTYDEGAEQRLRFIGAAKRLELSLASIRDLLAVWDADACRSVKAELRPMLDTRIAETGESIAALTELAGTLRAARARLDELPDRDEPCDPACVFLIEPAAPASIACSLDPGDVGERIAQWRALTRDFPPVRHADRLLLRAPRAQAARLAELAAAEQECCPFLGFELSFERDTVVLAIVAPAGAQDVLAAFLPETAA